MFDRLVATMEVDPRLPKVFREMSASFGKVSFHISY